MDNASKVYPPPTYHVIAPAIHVIATSSFLHNNLWDNLRRNIKKYFHISNGKGKNFLIEKKVFWEFFFWKKKFSFFFHSKRFFGTFPPEIGYFDPDRICSPESYLSDAKNPISKFQPEKKLWAKAQNLFGEFWRFLGPRVDTKKTRCVFCCELFQHGFWVTFSLKNIFLPKNTQNFHFFKKKIRFFFIKFKSIFRHFPVRNQVCWPRPYL